MLYESKLSREPFQGRAIPIFSKIPKKGSKKERRRLLSISALMHDYTIRERKSTTKCPAAISLYGVFPLFTLCPYTQKQALQEANLPCNVSVKLFLEGRFIEGEILVLLLQGWFSASACFNVNTKRKTNGLSKKKKCSRLELTFPRGSNILLKTVIWPCQLWVVLLDFFTNCLQQPLKRKSCISKRCIRWAGILKEDLRTVECPLLAKEASFMEPETCPCTHPLPPCPSLSFLLRAIRVCKTGYLARPSSNPWQSAWFDGVQWQSVYPQLSEYNVLVGKN